jgi:nucleoside phosphorylase/tetratricopeptide (TPR) repeat protein
MTLTHDDYTVAWICALPLELAAAKTMLDESHPLLLQPKTDHNAYTLGSISGHNVVIACLPSGVYGTISASTVVSHLVSTYTNIRFGLMVGIGGGVPSNNADIRLGDVVVSKPTGTSAGVIQYDYGKMLHDGQFQHTGSLNRPPPILLKAMAQMESDYMTGKRLVSRTMIDALQKNEGMKEKFSRPQNDWLFQPTYNHKVIRSDCSECDQSQLVNRPLRTSNDPYIHYGLIASGDQVMKDASTRDSIAQKLDILCFEMEAAGLMDELPSLAIRGICDYCDSHKQKQWQRYAALAAAAYAKALLLKVPIYHRKQESPKSIDPVWAVPFGKNPRFVGRESEITEIEGLMMQSHGPSKIAIYGLGGVGKTQIALELAYRMRERDSSCSIFWIPCTSYESVEQAYMTIAHKVGIHNVKPAEAKDRLKVYLSQERAGKWLLIFDNADDMDMWIQSSTGAPVLTDLLPQSEQGRILFTTRNRKLAVKLASSHVINISEPDTEAALTLLGKLLIRKELLKDRDAAIGLLRRLALLPLAIAQAAAFINENNIRLSEYTALLQEQEPDVIGLLSEHFGDEWRYKDIQNPVATTWLISFHQIQRLNQTAANYLSFMACINAQDIPQPLLPPAISRKEGIDAIGLLKAFSFVSEQAGDHSLCLHRLVHLSTRNWLRKNRLFSQQVLKTADRLSEVFPSDDYTNRKLWRDYLPHALSLIKEGDFQKRQEKYTDLVQKIGQCLYSDGRYTEAAVVFKNALRVQKKKRGDMDPSTLTSMAWLASTYRNQGRWKEAEGLGVLVINTRKQVLGPEHPSTLDSMANLAATYRNQGRWKEAEALVVQVMKMRKRLLGPDHPSSLNSMANLAAIYRSQGRLQEAETLVERVMNTRKQVLGPEHPSTLDSMANLAAIYRNQGRWKEAATLTEQVMKTRKHVLGPEHPSTLDGMANLAATYRNQGRWKEAEILIEHVMKRRKQLLGPQHPSTLNSMANLANTWKSQGRIRKALVLMEECVELRNKVLGPDHPDALSSSRALGKWKKELGQSQAPSRRTR